MTKTYNKVDESSILLSNHDVFNQAGKRWGPEREEKGSTTGEKEEKDGEDENEEEDEQKDSQVGEGEEEEE